MLEITQNEAPHELFNVPGKVDNLKPISDEPPDKLTIRKLETWLDF